MKEKILEVKVSDLLHHVGTDSWNFSQIQLTQLPQVDAQGISGSIALYSLNTESVLVKLRDISVQLHEVCDFCQTEYLRFVFVEEYTAKFTLNEEEYQLAEEDVLFLIDPKKETIDLSDMLFQAIELEEPFVHLCEACSLTSSTETSNEEEG